MAVGQAVLSVELTLDDRVSAGLGRVQKQTALTGQQFRSAATSLASFGTSMVGLLIASGALNSQTGRIVTTTLAFTSATIQAAAAIGPLIKLMQTWNAISRTSIVLQSILGALTGFGIARVGLALGVGAVAFGATTALMNRREPAGGGSAITAAVPRPAGAASSQRAGPTIVNNGVLVTNESAMRDLASSVTRVQKDNERMGR